MKKRIYVLDELRGLFIVLMVLYHLLYDLVFIFGINLPFYARDIMPLQPIIPIGFATIAGIGCFISGKNVRRGLIVFGCGLVISVATLIFMPGQAVIFGVLSMLGAGTVLCGVVKKLLLKVNPLVGGVVATLLFVVTFNLIYNSPVPDFIASSPLYQSGVLLVIGYPAPGFYSSDYFPIIPWVFAIFLGFFMGRVLLKNPPNFIYNSYIKPLGFIGRHSLLIYMLHQPVIYGLLYLWFVVI